MDKKESTELWTFINHLQCIGVQKQSGSLLEKFALILLFGFCFLNIGKIIKKK